MKLIHRMTEWFKEVAPSVMRRDTVNSEIAADLVKKESGCQPMKPNDATMLTRRGFVRGCAPLALGSAALAQEHGPTSDRGVELKLAREYPNAYLVAISPDGPRMALYVTENPPEEALAQPVTRSAGRANETLRVIDLESGRETLSLSLRQRVFRGSFFCDGGRLYVETLAFPSEGRLVKQQSVIDLKSGKMDDRIRPEDAGGVSYSALCDGKLLGIVANEKSRKTEALSLASLPNYAEIARAPFALAERDPNGNSTELAFASNRKTFAYAVDGSIVCRRGDDLGIAWTRKVEPGLKVWRVAMSPDGSHVAAASVDTAFIEQQRNFYIGVYSAKDGSPIGRLPVNGFEGIAISTGGKLLAAGRRVVAEGKLQEIRPTVQVYDVASAQLKVTVIHDRVRAQSGQFLRGSFNVNGIQFTEDGKHLITSGTSTKVWTVERSE